MDGARQKTYITVQALRDAYRQGLADSELVATIQRMLFLSAPLRDHPEGNRRYEDWVFKVERNKVKRVHLISCPVCEDRKRIDIEDEGKMLMVPCPHCTGANPGYNHIRHRQDKR